MTKKDQAPNYIFVIKDTQTGLFWKAGSKVAWATPGAAKNSWNLHEGKSGSYDEDYKDRLYFDDQTRYALFELKSDILN